MPSAVNPDVINQITKSASFSGVALDLDTWVIASMILHFLLIVLGLMKRRMKGRGSPVLVAVIYLYAITVANYAMGVVPDKTTRGGRTGEIRVFWAPFLILHLGGPSSITVISVSDNELWLRYAIHLVTLSYTFGRVFFHNYFLENDLWLATLLVFLAGAIKYIERVGCLFAARLTKYRESTFPDPGPGVNYARLMITYITLKKSNVPAEFRIMNTTTATSTAVPASAGPVDDPVVSATIDGKLTRLQIVREALRLFRAFQGLFVNMTYSYSQRDKSRSLFLKLDADQAFAICGAELKLAYDIFYTKFLLLRNTVIWVAVLNLFAFALQLLSLLIWIRVDKSQQFQSGSIKVTHALVYGSIALDIISLHTLITSDWVVSRVYDDANVGRRTGFILAFLRKLLLLLKPQILIPYTQQSSVSIQQLNLLTTNAVGYLLPFKLMYSLLFSGTLEVPDEVTLPGDLQKFLFHELQTRSNLAQEPRDVAEICNSRGMWALTLLSGKYGSKEIDLARDFGPWISGVDYAESVVLWHIATTLCWEPDSEGNHLSKIISDYMFYLLLRDPKMMPRSAKFLGMITFRDTKAAADRLFGTIRPPRSSSDDWVSEARKKIMEVKTDLIAPKDVRGQESRSVLFEASILAKKLQSLEEMGINKWEVINKVWAEMLFYAAAHCRSSVHVERLTQGTQLLTIVWLMMAHLGLGKHFRHNKAKERRAHLVINKLA